MRSIRNAAVAGVTALAVSLSGVTAFAAETPAPSETNTASENTKPAENTKPGENAGKEGENKGTEGSSTPDKPGTPKADSSLSAKLSPKFDGDKAVTGADALGSHKLDDKDLPKWFTAWKGFTIAGIVLTVLTNLIAPAYNYLKFNGII